MSTAFASPTQSVPTVITPLYSTDAAPDLSEVGRKAKTLHALGTLGLPVPPALALSWRLVAQIDAGNPSSIQAAKSVAATLHYPLAVRSSTNVEDGDAGAAPGLFESFLDIKTPEKLVDAICAVVASTQTPLVAAYLQRRDISRSLQVSVILQEQIIATGGQGVLYTRSPGQPEGPMAVLEREGHAPLWIDRETSACRISTKSGLTQDQALRLWKIAASSEKILEAPHGLDIEWVWDHRGPWIVQARPIVHRASLQASDRPEISALLAFSCDDHDRLWKLDATHNPFPCSPAQAGLVEAVSEDSPYDMKIVGGYLYTAKRKSPNLTAPLSAAALQTLYYEDLLPKINAALALPESQAAPTLHCAITAYKTVFRYYTEELSPALAASDEEEGGNPLSIWLERAHLGEITTEELLQSVSPIAPAWDVSAPTYGETPSVVLRALTSIKTTHLTKDARISLRESDDILFYRAQFQVRRALLALAKRWGLKEEIFYISLALLLRHEKDDTLASELLEQAAAAQVLHRERQTVEMPLAFIGGGAVPTRLPPDSELWRGIGTGPSVQGTVVRVTDLHSFPQLCPDDNAILVMPAVTPAHALAARGALAVVCEYGDHLGHGAAMARELGIPCIVGCRRSWRELRTGDTVVVHGQAGLVVRISKT